MDKSHIASHFAKAIRTYPAEAEVQRHIARRMTELLAEWGAKRGGNVLEVGCGTGHYSRLLRRMLHPRELLLNDLCPEMEGCFEAWAGDGQVRFVAGDAETLDFPAGRDLITSCSTLQWFERPEQFFARCRDRLHTGGMLAFSTFGTENMREIRALTGNGLDYVTAEQLTRMLDRQGFLLLHAEEERRTMRFDNPMQVLRHLKHTGVNGIAAGRRIRTCGDLRHFCEAYAERFTQQGRVTLTYHPIYIIAQKGDQR